MAQKCLSRYKKPNTFHKILRNIGCTNDEPPIYQEMCHKYYFYCLRPHEPDDILWENLH